MSRDSHWVWTYCTSIHLPPAPLILLRGAGGTLNIGKPAVPGTGRQQGVLGVTESPGLASEQGGSSQCFIIIFKSDTTANKFELESTVVYSLSWHHEYRHGLLYSSINFQAPESSDIPSVVLHPLLALCLKTPPPPPLHPPTRPPTHIHTFLLTHWHFKLTARLIILVISPTKKPQTNQISTEF